MEGKGEREFIAMVLKLCHTMNTNAPEKFPPWFVSGIMMNVVGNLPDDYWEYLTTNEHCEKEDCHSCNVMKIVMPALTELRAYYQKLMKKDMKEMKIKNFKFSDEEEDTQQGTEQSFST